MSTALSRLNAFLDSELETILCNDTEIDAEKFCKEKSAIFIIMPEEDSSKYFMVSLLIQQLYREILAVADENNGKLQNRVVFYCDEFGTLPKIESAEMMLPTCLRKCRDTARATSARRCSFSEYFITLSGLRATTTIP